MMTSDLLFYLAMAATLAVLVARTLRSEGGAHRFFANPFKKSFARKHEFAILAFKKCPQCAEQIPVSTLVCDHCDHNFLAGSVLRHKLLPAPEPLTNAASHQPLAYRA